MTRRVTALLVVAAFVAGVAVGAVAVWSPSREPELCDCEDADEP